MKKNKLTWIIALVLIITLIIPIAYAQSFSLFGYGVPNLKAFLANAAVIFFVLFLLQAILVPNKDGKEKTSMWLIMLAAALLISWLYGGTGYIWKTGFIGQFFSKYVWYVVLGNTVIIGAALYFIFGLLKVNEKLGNTNEGKIGYSLIIIIMSLLLSIKFAGNDWIWSHPVMLQLFDYLFGPNGLLNPADWGMYVFLGSFFLLAFFFNNNLLKDNAGSNKFVNYGLAFLIASNMARSGVKMRSVIIMGEMIFTIILAKSLETSVPKKEWGLNWIAAIILVGWASAAATYGTEFQGFFAGVVGKPLVAAGLISGTTLPGQPPPISTGSWGIYGIGALILAVIATAGVAMKGKGGAKSSIPLIILLLGICYFVFGFGKYSFIIIALILFIFFAIFRGENRERLKKLFIGGFKKRFNQIRRKKKYLRDTPEGREPSIFVENRIILQAMVNYTTRSEITYRYWGVVKGAAAHAGQLMTDIGEFRDPKKLRQDLIAYRSGGKDSEGRSTLGWNKLNLEVISLLNQFFELAQRVAVSADNKFKDPGTGFGPEGAQFNAIQARAQELLRFVNDNHRQYEIREKAFSAHHIIKGYREIILTMSNVTGEFNEHPMKFARPGAMFKGGNGYFGPSFEAKADPSGNPFHEVNQYGEYVKDIVALKVNLFDDDTPNITTPDITGSVNAKEYEKRKPRRVNPGDIIDYYEFPSFLRFIELDWQALAQDIRYGLWHPKSRSKNAYTHALAKNIYPEWADAEIEGHSEPTKEDPALDLRTLADPGRNIYWGREEFTDDIPPKKNPWPAVTSLGLKEYMETRIVLDMKDQTQAAKYMLYYPIDEGAEEKVVEKGKVKVPIGGKWGHVKGEN